MFRRTRPHHGKESASWAFAPATCATGAIQFSGLCTRAGGRVGISAHGTEGGSRTLSLRGLSPLCMPFHHSRMCRPCFHSRTAFGKKSSAVRSVARTCCSRRRTSNERTFNQRSVSLMSRCSRVHPHAAPPVPYLRAMDGSRTRFVGLEGRCPTGRPPPHVPVTHRRKTR